jgi:hypothetical protein
VKAALTGKLMAVKSNAKIEERSQVCNLTSHPKVLEKEE